MGGHVVWRVGRAVGDMMLYLDGNENEASASSSAVGPGFLLTPARSMRLKEAYRRQRDQDNRDVRHLMGLRAAAFLTAGIARVPFGKFLWPMGSCLVAVTLLFRIAYFFADHIKAIYEQVHRVERWLGPLVLVLATAAVIIVVRRRETASRRRARRAAGRNAPTADHGHS